METAEEILADPSRVLCLRYSANISREACLKQQELAARQNKRRLHIDFRLRSDRWPCLDCKQGREIKAAPNRQKEKE